MLPCAVCGVVLDGMLGRATHTSVQGLRFPMFNTVNHTKQINMKNTNTLLFTGNTTVVQVQQWLQDKNDQAQTNLIAFIQQSFNDQYIQHFRGAPTALFKMAMSCLIIDAIVSFQQGSKSNKSIGEKLYQDFFTMEEKRFPGFKYIAADFHKNIRGGLYNHLTTTDGWQMRKAGELLDQKNKIINANKFSEAVIKSFNNYTKKLRKEGFDAVIWQKAIRKIEYDIANWEIAVTK